MKTKEILSTPSLQSWREDVCLVRSHGTDRGVGTRGKRPNHADDDDSEGSVLRAFMGTPDERMDLWGGAYGRKGAGLCLHEEWLRDPTEYNPDGTAKWYNQQAKPLPIGGRAIAAPVSDKRAHGEGISFEEWLEHQRPNKAFTNGGRRPEEDPRGGG